MWEGQCHVPVSRVADAKEEARGMSKVGRMVLRRIFIC
jgi:hypothetical protein